MNIPGIRYGLSVYITSDRRGLDTVVSLESPIPLPTCDSHDLPALLKLLRSENVLADLGDVEDWRLMTEEEVRNYKEHLND